MARRASPKSEEPSRFFLAQTVFVVARTSTKEFVARATSLLFGTACFVTATSCHHDQGG